VLATAGVLVENGEAQELLRAAAPPAPPPAMPGAAPALPMGGPPVGAVL